MNLVLANYFRRWWWVLALAVAFQMLLVGSSFAGRKTNVMFLPMFAGPFLLLMDTQRGLIRALTPLPVARAEMGRKFWLATVLLPAIATVVVLLAGQLLYSLFTPKAFIDLGWLGLHGCLAFLMCGSMFYAFTGMATGPAAASAGAVRSQFFGALWGVTAGGSVIFTMSVTLDALVNGLTGKILLPLTIIATWLGWQERERMIAFKAGVFAGRDIAPASPALVPVYGPRGFGGIPFLVANMARSYVFFAMLIVGGLFAFGCIMYFNQAPMHPLDVGQHLLAGYNPGTVGIWLAINAVSLGPVFMIRALRTLPLKSTSITALLIGLPVIVSIVTGTLMYGLASFTTNDGLIASAAHRSAQSVLLLTIAVPMLLRWGVSPITFGAIIGVIPLAVVLSLPKLGWYSSDYFLPVALLIVVPLCTWITHRLVLCGSAPYRGELMSMPGWQTRA